MVIHNPDIQSYARLLKQAQSAAASKLVQLNLDSNLINDVVAAGTEIDRKAAEAIVDKYDAGKGISTKVATDPGLPTDASEVIHLH